MQKRKTVVLSILPAFALLALKLFLMKDVHLQIIGNAEADDGLMARHAASLLSLSWLGRYNQFTLSKGVFFPFFLAVTKALHIDMLTAVSLLYGFSCMVFVQAFYPVILPAMEKLPSEHSRVCRACCTKGSRLRVLLLYVLFTLLLFHPVMACHEVVQRVYRNSLLPSQVLLVFGGMAGLYFSEGRKRGLFFSAAASFGFASLWLSREDGFWIAPFVAVAAVLTAFKKRKLLLPFLPALVTTASVALVCLLNFFVYGVWLDTEIAGGNFPRLMKAIYQVDAGPEVSPYVSVSREKLKLLYRESPAMAAIEEPLERLMDAWAVSSGRLPENKENLEVENGWFFWVLRDAAAMAGYHADASTADSFYGQAAREIRQAFREGRLSRQASMPSALMPPWRKGMLPDLIREMGKSAEMVSSCDGLILRNLPAIGDEDQIALAEWAGGRSGLPSDYVEGEPGEEAENRPVNRINGLYKQFSFPVVWAGRLSFALLFLLLVSGKLKKAEKQLFLVLSGMLGALLCLYAGIAYNELRSCLSVVPMYLGGAYAPVLALHLLSVFAAAGALARLNMGRARSDLSSAVPRGKKGDQL